MHLSGTHTTSFPSSFNSGQGHAIPVLSDALEVACCLERGSYEDLFVWDDAVTSHCVNQKFSYESANFLPSKRRILLRSFFLDLGASKGGFRGGNREFENPHCAEKKSLLPLFTAITVF